MHKSCLIWERGAHNRQFAAHTPHAPHSLVRAHQTIHKSDTCGSTKCAIYHLQIDLEDMSERLHTLSSRERRAISHIGRTRSVRQIASSFIVFVARWCRVSMHAHSIRNTFRIYRCIYSICSWFGSSATFCRFRFESIDGIENYFRNHTMREQWTFIEPIPKLPAIKSRARLWLISTKKMNINIDFVQSISSSRPSLSIRICVCLLFSFWASTRSSVIGGNANDSVWFSDSFRLFKLKCNRK